LSINTLAEGLPVDVRPRFCGIHFFNPPRYMHLVEIIGTKSTDAGTLDALETWLTSRLGKGVIRALDTPNFVANRIGVFSILAVMHHTAAFGLGFDEVDALTGPKIGRPKSATYRTADVVGLDTLAHVVKTMQDTLPNDPWHAHFTTPAWLTALIAQGALGQKTRCGIFRKQGKEIQVLDLAKQDYRDLRRRNCRGSCRHPEDQESGREVCCAARFQPAASPVPVGDLPRHLPLRRRATGKRRRQCPRSRFRHALGLRLVARAV
jgi:3-hydroxyacyl-CoA dehydrogenase